MTLPRDLHQAQSFVDRAAAINAKADAVRMSIMHAINRAIIVVLLLGSFGAILIAAEEHKRDGIRMLADMINDTFAVQSAGTDKNEEDIVQ